MDDHPNTAPTPDTPPPDVDADELRAQLHEWLDTLDEEALLALWQLVYWASWPVGRREEGP